VLDAWSTARPMIREMSSEWINPEQKVWLHTTLASRAIKPKPHYSDFLVWTY